MPWTADQATPFVPSDFCNLDPTSILKPMDLVTIGADLAWMLDVKREDLAGWYRTLGLALFERFGLTRLPQRPAFADAVQGADLMRALGAVDIPDWSNGLGRAWAFREHLLALPSHVSGVLEGHPFQLSVSHQEMPPPLRPMAEDVADHMLKHSGAAKEIARKLDWTIIGLWGCPLERLELKVTVAELAASGLEIQTFEP
ncbi:hypothetical protein [Corallococcus aberystwythensis]|uniref:Uncharacterized protein n=1 Tax=Corallococcus aberystwythensis TaxID=2316722 RepID=A0A3A8QIQ0_9BACT|nr:hypothetical protein [Corallococcus aberystwythensis]RKH63054.1 hypothetical protein D7W81_21125 [Corallococcus aberystwythensis]